MKLQTKDMVLLSVLTAQAIVLHYIEGFIPVIAPGAKLGLANLITIVALYRFNLKYALVISIIRISLGSLIGGNIMGILFGLSGGLLSLAIMYVLKRYPNYFSIIGVSTAGAAFHNLGQLITASLLYNTMGILFTYLPILMLASAITGYFIGLASHYIIDYLGNTL